MNELLSRIKHVTVSFWTAVDQVLQVMICTPIFLATGRARPSSRRTISALLGQAEALGYKWAVPLVRIVDAVAGTGHCHGAYLRDKQFEFPL